MLLKAPRRPKKTSKQSISSSSLVSRGHLFETKIINREPSKGYVLGHVSPGLAALEILTSQNRQGVGGGRSLIRNLLTWDWCQEEWKASEDIKTVEKEESTELGKYWNEEFKCREFRLKWKLFFFLAPIIVLYISFWCHHNGKAKEWTQWNIWKYEVMRRRMFHSASNVKIYNIQKHF